MKLAITFLAFCVALISCSGDALLMDALDNSMAESVAALAPAAEVAAGAMPKLALPFNPLKLMLASVGVPVEHLIQGSEKCVTELGPEAVGAVKALLSALTFFG